MSSKTSITDVIGAIPYRMAFAGGWINQPLVSQHNPDSPGSMVVVGLEPTFWYMERAGMATHCQVLRRSIAALELPGANALIVTNPPYGERIGDVEKLHPLYTEIGDALKARATGATAWLLVGNRELAGAIGLRASRRIRVFNGPIECRFLRFDLYEGSRKGDGGQKAGAGG